jgi:hypothetical protein
MSTPDLNDEEFALLTDAVRRGAVRITLSTRGRLMPGGADRLAVAERLRAAGLLTSPRKGQGPGTSREDDVRDFMPTVAGCAIVDARAGGGA